MPVSSPSSRSAVVFGASPGSMCPLGQSQRLRWRSTSTCVPLSDRWKHITQEVSEKQLVVYFKVRFGCR
eukprot:m.309014 g.309014  ORF g.309014 m.309014 type:complete len:69 (+) comp19634_c2_seq22:407-613(+)